MGLNVRILNIVYGTTYSLRYKSGDYPYPENIDSTFTLYGTGLTNSTITLSGLSFDTQYWIKMTDDLSGRYIIKNIYTNDSKSFPCYDTICFDVVVVCVSPSPTPTITPTTSITPSVTPTISVTPSRTPSVTPTISVTPSILTSVSPTPSITPSLTPTPSITPSLTPTPTITPSVTPSITSSITPSLTPTTSITPSLTPSLTPSITSSITPSLTPTTSITPSLTPSVTPTPTRTVTPTPSSTPCACSQYSVQNNEATSTTVGYTSCTTGQATSVVIGAGATSVFCSCSFPESIPPGKNITITLLGACPPPG